MDPCDLAAFVTAVACAIAKCTPDDEELLVWALAFAQLSNTLETIAAQRTLVLKQDPSNEPAGLDPEDKILFKNGAGAHRSMR